MRILSTDAAKSRAIAAVLGSVQSAIAQSAPGEDIAGKLINDRAAAELARFITDDPRMRELKDNVILLANVNDPVLITGPSGTGKEILARALHGFRPANKFFAVNCAAMPEQLIESELFGHVAGAFTGASMARTGILAAAKDGTVFLDEIGEAPLALQAKLLRVLQPAVDGKYYIRPVGATEYIAIECRIVAATKCNLLDHVSRGLFREDLYGRLMTFELATTPLSARRCDIQLILDHLCVPNGVRSLLDSHEWATRIDQFNVRALQAFARRAKVYGWDNDNHDSVTDNPA